VPRTSVVFFREETSHVPVLDWLEGLRLRDPSAYAKCVARIQRLAEEGHALRRPEADYVRDGIHELRAKRGRVNLRILFFFHGRSVAVLAYALAKEDRIPSVDLERAVSRQAAFRASPARHRFEGTP